MTKFGEPLYGWSYANKGVYQYRGTSYTMTDLRPLDDEGKPITKPKNPIGFQPPKKEVIVSES